MQRATKLDVKSAKSIAHDALSQEQKAGVETD